MKHHDVSKIMMMSSVIERRNRIFEGGIHGNFEPYRIL